MCCIGVMILIANRNSPTTNKASAAKVPFTVLVVICMLEHFTSFVPVEKRCL